MNYSRVLAALLMSVSMLPALAQDDDANGDDRNPDDPTYSSFRLGMIDADFDNLKQAFNLGYTLGFRFPGFDFAGVELDISSTVIPGENRGAGPSPIGGGGNDNGGNGGLLDDLLGGGGGGGGDGNSQQGSSSRNTRSGSDLLTNTLGIYLRAETPRRYSERFFASARVGYNYIDTNIPELIEDGRGKSSFGAGIGYRYGRDGRVELTYTQRNSDLFEIGLGVSF